MSAIAPTAAAEPETEEAAGPETSDGLFDRSQYDDPGLQIPKTDGQAIDKIRIKFAGDVMLDRSDPADVALYNRLKLGHEVELRCAGKVSKTATGWTTSKDGDLDAVVADRTLKIETVWVLDPEQLNEPA